jgi:hypothetical protein
LPSSLPVTATIADKFHFLEYIQIKSISYAKVKFPALWAGLEGRAPGHGKSGQIFTLEISYDSIFLLIIKISPHIFSSLFLSVLINRAFRTYFKEFTSNK